MQGANPIDERIFNQLKEKLGDAAALEAIAKLQNAQKAKESKSMTETLAIATGFFSCTLSAIAFPPSVIGLAAVGALWLYENRNR